MPRTTSSAAKISGMDDQGAHGVHSLHAVPRGLPAPRAYCVVNRYYHLGCHLAGVACGRPKADLALAGHPASPGLSTDRRQVALVGAGAILLLTPEGAPC